MGLTKRTLQAVQEVTAHQIEAHDEPFNVVPVIESPVPKVISSITPVPAVHLPISLLVAMLVVNVRFVDKSHPPESGAVVEIVLIDETFASRADCRSVWSERVPVIVPQTPFADIVLSVNSERLGLYVNQYC